MAEIPVRKYGKVVAVALVDEEDYERINAHRWTLQAYGYAMRSGPAVLMHREVMNTSKGDGLEVRHLNHDKLDNRKANLSVVMAHTALPSWPDEMERVREARATQTERLDAYHSSTVRPQPVHTEA